MWELTKSFRFEAAHTLERGLGGQASRRIHGHSYRAVIALRGTRDPATGMLLDLAELAARLGAIQEALDHRLLDEVPGLGPATLENLAAYIFHEVAPVAPQLARVVVHRDSLDESCAYDGTAP